MQKEQQLAAATAADPKAPVPPPMTVRLLAKFLGDETGKPLFDIKVEADRLALLDFPVGVAADLLRFGNQVNKLDEDVKAKNA
jgi:hypothetical protein